MRSTKKQALNQNLSKPNEVSHYGTAGYRLNTPDLNNVICRASIIAYIRSATFAGKYIGLYITASHNPIEYNGVKFVDFNGNMLEESWELGSDELVNCEDSEFNTIINKLFRQNSNYNNMQDSIYGNVIIGRDTRQSGVTLTQNIKEVLSGYRCNVFEYDEVTCPEMHYLVRKCNEKNEIVNKTCYIDHLYSNFIELQKITGKNLEISIDTANGVAKNKFDELMEKDPHFKVEILNDPVAGILNKDCGADFIKVKKVAPKIRRGSFSLAASFDGDVDRLIFYNQNIKIFDGDAQCAFIANYIKSLADSENIQCEIGVVLSHYSNMGAVEYLQKNFKVVYAQTGIKNFVREARKFDVGVYFEPNGHGSVTFSKKFLEKIDENKKGKTALSILTEMFDPCVGDALANFLVFKAVLSSFEDFNKYKENYSRLLTVKIKDKNRIRVDQNNLVLEPDIQKDIDQQNLAFKGRGFVRPSGTEDVVRVFAECSRRINAISWH